MPYVGFDRKDDPIEYDREYNRQAISERRAEIKLRTKQRQLPSDREADWRRHGIKLSYVRYLRMLEDCDYMCEICSTHVGESGCVDHDHENGKVRGILCKDCNLMIQFASDNPAILHLGTMYLLKER